MQTINQNIVVVDDTPANLTLLIDILSVYGYLVRPASTGNMALLTIQNELPDLIMLDIMLPDMDGYEICRQVKQTPGTADIPVIFISALEGTFDKVKGFAVGGVDYITKPFEEQEVLARVQTQLMVRALQQELHLKNQALQQSNLALAQANETLNQQVEQRTLELATTNATLKAEMAHRQQQQADKDNLLALVRQQSEQLHQLTSSLVQAQQAERDELAKKLTTEVASNLAWIDTMCKQLNETNLASSQTFAKLKTLQQRSQQTQTALNQLIDQLNQPSPTQQTLTDNPRFNLSVREQEILQLILANKTNPEITEILHLSLSSVKTYRRRLMTKLKVNTITDLVKVAVKHGLID